MKSASESDSDSISDEELFTKDKLRKLIEDDVENLNTDVLSDSRYPIIRNTKYNNFHTTRLPFFCKSLSEMKPISTEIIRDKRNIIYKLVIKKFNISDDLLKPENIEDLLTKISSPELFKILIRAYDISFFGRKYRRYTGITGCKAKICINNNCFETTGYKDLTNKTDTVISINFDTDKLKHIIQLINTNKSNTYGFFGEKITNGLNCIQLIFEHELIHSFVNCFCLSFKNYNITTNDHSNIFKNIAYNLFGHNLYTHDLLIK
jgi:hypothetical protein